MDMQAFYTGHAFDAYEFFGDVSGMRQRKGKYAENRKKRESKKSRICKICGCDFVVDHDQPGVIWLQTEKQGTPVDGGTDSPSG